MGSNSGSFTVCVTRSFSIVLRFEAPSISSIGEGLHIGDVRMRWDIRFRTDARTADGAAFAHAGKAMGGDNHVLMLLGETDSKLALRGWSETPDAAITYLRGLYLAGADRGVLGDD